MAVFDPQVQPASTYAQPNFDRLAGTPITQPLADTSTGESLKTIGVGIEGGAELADRTVKDIINRDVNDTIDPIRNDFTQQLENVRQAQTGIVPGTNASPSNAQASVPDAIHNALGKVDSLQAALSNGKINDTYYHSRLAAAVTDLRSKYPGYRDYIDQRVAESTGVKPANAYMSDLMSDINRMQTSKKTDLDRAVDDTTKSGYPGSQEQLQALQSKGNDYLPQWRNWYATQTQLDATLKRRDAFRKDTKGNLDDIKQQRTSDFTNEVGAAITSNFNSIQSIAGLSTPQSILKVAADAAANPGKYTDAQMQGLATKLQAQKAIVTSQMQDRARQTSTDSQGRTYSYASDVGAENVNNIIKTTVDSAYDPVMQALINKDAGTAFAAMNHARAILDQSKDNLLSDEKLGDWAAKITNFNTMFGPNWTNLTTSEGLRADIDDKMREHLNSKTMDARLQSQYAKDGTPITMQQHADEALKLEQQGQITKGMRARYLNNLVNIVDDIKNPQAPLQDKINVMRYFFSPEGQGLLKNFRTDYTDPTTGKYVPGKYAVFTRFTSPDILKEVNKMPQDIKNMYRNYLENEAGSQLFYKEFQNLNFQTGQEDLHFAYNDGGNGGVPSISLIDKGGKPMSNIYGAISQAPSQIQEVQKSVNRLNEALAGMSRVEKEFGGNASDYALSFMIHSQVDLGKNWTGLPEKLMDAIAATRGKRKLEDTFKEQKQ